jgi:hypothetical protein
MDKNVDGSEITTDQLCEMMRAIGKDPDKILGDGHGASMQRSDLLDATLQFRYDLWSKGQLKLDSTMWVPPPTPEHVIDPFWFELRDKGRKVQD